MLTRRIFLFALVALAVSMAGCGYRGALYLPEDAPEQSRTTSGDETPQAVSDSEQP